mgnify:CR=1 FL=1
MEMMCGKCRFYAPTAGPSEGGYCRRYPPVIVPEERGQGDGGDVRAQVSLCRAVGEIPEKQPDWHAVISPRGYYGNLPCCGWRFRSWRGRRMGSQGSGLMPMLDSTRPSYRRATTASVRRSRLPCTAGVRLVA